jgi:hypothetical protein
MESRNPVILGNDRCCLPVKTVGNRIFSDCANKSTLKEEISVVQCKVSVIRYIP